MSKTRLDLLKEVYLNAVNNKDLFFRLDVSAEDFTELHFSYQYLEEKGYIKIHPVAEDGSTTVSITLNGVDFVEDVEDFVSDYWRK